MTVGVLQAPAQLIASAIVALCEYARWAMMAGIDSGPWRVWGDAT